MSQKQASSASTSSIPRHFSQRWCWSLPSQLPKAGVHLLIHCLLKASIQTFSITAPMSVASSLLPSLLAASPVESLHPRWCVYSSCCWPPEQVRRFCMGQWCACWAGWLHWSQFHTITQTPESWQKNITFCSRVINCPATPTSSSITAEVSSPSLVFSRWMRKYNLRCLDGPAWAQLVVCRGRMEVWGGLLLSTPVWSSFCHPIHSTYNW